MCEYIGSSYRVFSLYGSVFSKVELLSVTKKKIVVNKPCRHAYAC